MQAELVFDARDGVGESPVWIGAQQSLFWVDIPGRRLHRWEVASGRHTEWNTAEMPACIAPAGEASWVCGMETGVYRLRLQDSGEAQAEPVAPVRHAGPGMRFNDGRCDRQGRLLAGTMAMDMAAARPDGVLYRLQGDGHLQPLVSGLVVPNGLAFSPDGRTLYLSDSHPSVQAIWSFDYDTDTGLPSNRRLFVDMKPLPGRPDGAAIDEDGCYWICGNDAGLVHRFTPQGRLDRSLPVPVKKPAMCAFGGPRLDTLYVTSIRPAGTDLSDQPLAGGLFALQPGICGLPEPGFAF